MMQKNQQNPHHEVGEIPNTNESVQDIEFPEGWTECLLASQEPGHPIIAIGKVFNTSDIKSVMIHNKPLQHGNLKVEVIEAKMTEAPLPVPTVEALVVVEAVNSFVEWPKSLIFLGKDATAESRKRKRDSLKMDNHSESSNTIKKGQPKMVSNELEKTAEQAFKLKTSSLTIQMMYKIARNMETALSVPLDKVLSHDGQLWITKEEIFQWLFQEEIQATHISVYIGYLMDTFPNMLARFGYLCPHKIAEVPIGFKVDRQKDRHMLTKERATWKARYISYAMKDAKKNQIFFAPYNAKKHWMLCVLNPYKETVYWFDPLGFQVMDDFKSIIESAMKMWLAQINLNRPKKSVKWIEGKCPRQPNNTDCGYNVLRYILDIIRMEQDSYPGESYQQYGSNPLKKDKIDEVRDQWVSFVQNFML